MGKSLFMRKFLYGMAERIQKLDAVYKYGEQPLICISSLNCITKSYKLNGMRAPLRQMFRRFALRNNRMPPNIELLKEMIPSLDKVNSSMKGKDNKEFEHTFLKRHIDVMLEVFGLKERNYIEEFGEFGKPDPRIPTNIILQHEYMINSANGEIFTYT